MKERDHWKDQGIDEVRLDLREIDCGVCSEFNWLRIGIGGEML
jgi:hypothetical protein